MSRVHIPEQFKIVDASRGPITTNGAVTCDYVSLKNVHMAWIIASFTQAVGHATGIDPIRATADAVGNVAIATAVPCWLNEDTATTDTLVRQTDAITVNVDNTIDKKMVVFQVDPAQLGATYDWLSCIVDASSQATNFVSIVYLLETRYPQATPPAAIT